MITKKCSIPNPPKSEFSNPKRHYIIVPEKNANFEGDILTWETRTEQGPQKHTALITSGFTETQKLGILDLIREGKLHIVI